MVQPSSSRRETFWRLLQSRNHARRPADFGKEGRGAGRTSDLPLPSPEPLQLFSDHRAAVRAHRQEYGTRRQRAALRRRWNWEKYNLSETGVGLVFWNHAKALQAADSVFLRRPQTDLKVRHSSVMRVNGLCIWYYLQHYSCNQSRAVQCMVQIMTLVLLWFFF